MFFKRFLQDDDKQRPRVRRQHPARIALEIADEPQPAARDELPAGGDLFFWPPGHTVKVTSDAEIILFSPQKEHSEVIDHMLKKMAG